MRQWSKTHTDISDPFSRQWNNKIRSESILAFDATRRTQSSTYLDFDRSQGSTDALKSLVWSVVELWFSNQPKENKVNVEFWIQVKVFLTNMFPRNTIYKVFDEHKMADLKPWDLERFFLRNPFLQFLTPVYLQTEIYPAKIYKSKIVMRQIRVEKFQTPSFFWNWNKYSFSSHIFKWIDWSCQSGKSNWYRYQFYSSLC